MNATATAASPEPYQFTGVNNEGYACYDETGPDEVTETIPLPEPGDIMRALNATRKPKPLPLCRECNYPIEPHEAGNLFARTCIHCEVSKIYRLLEHLTRSFGKRVARAKFEALCRLEPCPSIGPIPFGEARPAGGIRPAGEVVTPARELSTVSK